MWKFQERLKKNFLEEPNGKVGRFIVSYLILPNPKMDDCDEMEKDLKSLFIERVGQKKRFSCE